MNGFLVTAHGKEQGPEFAQRLREVLVDHGTYSSHAVLCFWPGIGYRVWNGDRYVDVLICFECGNLTCGPPGQHGPTRSFLNSPRRRDLVRLAKEAFPDDKEIQALED